MPYGWQIKLNGVDISDKVSGFSITCSLDSYCREMSLDIADRSLYDSLDFSQISESPEIEILTKVGDTFISQGTFYIERPILASTINSDLMQGVWGRSLTAMLGEPFAPKVTKVWETQTTLFGICEEMCSLAGFTWDPAYSDISDFIVFSSTYEAENVYPVDIITELAELAGALVTTDRLGHLCIRQIDYAPVAADITITDPDIEQISESPEWPTFGNRIVITPTGSVSGYSVTLTIADECLSADGESRTKLYAQVKDSNDEPVDGIVVSWSIDSNNSALDFAQSNTQEVLIRNEKQKASNFYNVAVDLNPSSVLGIWAASDTARAINLASAGYELDGNKITLSGKLTYCDQTLVISYYCAGSAINYLTAGLVAEDVTITADVEGQEDTGIVYIDNPCQCPPSIELTAAPRSIAVGDQSALLVYVEENGPVTSGRYVFMSDRSAEKKGTLNWTRARLGTVSISNERSTAVNEIAGLTQCGISMFPKSVSAVYRADENGSPYGSNLYSSHAGKIINLTTQIDNGTDLLVNYVAQGAALNHFTAAVIGNAKVKAYIDTTLEAGLEAETNISIEDNAETTDDYPPDFKKGAGDGGAGDSGGDDNDFDMSDIGSSESGGLYNWCVPKNVSNDPSPDNLQGRFATGIEHDCSCEEMCNTEFYIHNTTQNYDGGSGRSISKIVVDDYGLAEGGPAYWEKHAELKQAALDACVNQCTTCDMVDALAWGDSNPETIVRSTSVGISVAGGLGPYTWSVSGTGFTLGSGVTETGANTLIADGTACGSADITVIDKCGLPVTGYVRCTTGTWTVVSSCSKTRPCSMYYCSRELISGNTKKNAYWCCARSTGTCSDICINTTSCVPSGGACDDLGLVRCTGIGTTSCYANLPCLGACACACHGSSTSVWTC